ncbi:hypothetical protein MIZ01_1790 [Sideroxyarcus emersonii]|uniref:Uncharacterized protein n=1 Tax=Sideroxyarcus emersonii TaxID=2764705 RepID=A0AAN1XBB3_9PROT|nr:hypothetical protein MIZ01_1790 [Sideroxyarcus emersonii]
MPNRNSGNREHSKNRVAAMAWPLDNEVHIHYRRIHGHDIPVPFHPNYSLSA